VSNFHPRKFLDLAKALLDSERNEEGARTATGRAYYAAYLTGYLKLQYSAALREAKSQSDSVHEQLKLAFAQSDHPEISDMLGDLFDRRVIADYFPGEAVNYDGAKNSVELGEKITSLIESDP